MVQLDTIATLVVFAATMVGLIVYLRAEARSSRAEWKAELGELKSDIRTSKDVLCEQLIQRLDESEYRLAQRIDKFEYRLTQRMDQFEARFIARTGGNHPSC